MIATTGIKYCGGCNSRYDRKSVAEILAADFPAIRFVSAGTPADFILVICGCPAQCAGHRNLYGKHGKFIFCCESNYEKFREMVAEYYEARG